MLDYKFDPPALAFGVVTIQSFGGPFAVSMSTPVRQSGHLARFELPLSVSEFFPRPEADITFWVLPMVNEFPSDVFSDALATGVIDASKLPVLQEASTPLFTSVTLAERPAVTAGQRIALVVQSDPTGTFMWSMASGNLFPEGDPYGRRLCDSSTGAECPVG